MKTTITTKNIMGCGCPNMIHKELGSLTGVYGIKVNPEKNQIIIDHTDEVTPDILCKKLTEMGYEAKPLDQP